MALFANTASNDSPLGTVAADFFSVAAGDGVGAGNDNFHGFEGDDTVEGGLDNDSLFGGIGNDILFAGTGVDTLFGGSGDDFLYVVFGETGAIFGGSGFDTVLFEFPTAGVTVDLQGNIAGSFLLSKVEGVWGTGFADLITGSIAANSFVGFFGNDTFFGGAGADTLEGGRDDDLLFGGNGDDQIYGGGGIERLYGGAGRDFIFIDISPQTGDADFVKAGPGDDVVQTTGGNDTLFGGTGEDTLYLRLDADIRADLSLAVTVINLGPGERVEISGFESLITLAGDDRLKGGSGATLLQAGGGNDRLQGLAGADTLRGEAGNDSLYGGGDIDLLAGDDGLDQLFGGGSADGFEFKRRTDSPLATPDVIGDFVSGVDKIVMSVFFDITTFRLCSFSFIGAGAFSGLADEVRFSGGVVQADSNRDGVADFAVVLTGVVAVAASDFVF